MADTSRLTADTQAYMDALQDDNLLGAINQWNEIERRYLTGSEPGVDHWVVYDGREDEIDRVPSLPLDRVVREYNEWAARRSQQGLTQREEEDVDKYQQMLLETLEDKFSYFTTANMKTFYEQGGTLYLLDEQDAEEGRTPIQQIDTITDGLYLEDIVDTYELVQLHGDIDWEGMFNQEEILRKVARELYNVSPEDAGDTLEIDNTQKELLYDGRGAYLYDTDSRQFEEVDDDTLAQLGDDDRETLFEELFDTDTFNYQDSTGELQEE